MKPTLHQYDHDFDLIGLTDKQGNVALSILDSDHATSMLAYHLQEVGTPHLYQPFGMRNEPWMVETTSPQVIAELICSGNVHEAMMVHEASARRGCLLALGMCVSAFKVMKMEATHALMVGAVETVAERLFGELVDVQAFASERVTILGVRLAGGRKAIAA